MAKIIVTETPFWRVGQGPVKRIIDANDYTFEEGMGGMTRVVCEHGEFYVKESMEEVQKRINEAEAQATNKKLDEILKNQVMIIKKLEDIHDDMRFISEEVDALT